MQVLSSVRLEHAQQSEYLERVKADFNAASESYAIVAEVQRDNYRYLFDFVIDDLLTDFCLQDFKWGLDLGAGPGIGLQIFCDLLAKYQSIPHWLALDISHSMVHRSHQTHKLVGDMNSLPIADQSVDLLLSNFALHWSHNLDQSFHEMHRVLRPGGVIAVSLPVAGSFDLLKKVWHNIGLAAPLHSMPFDTDIVSMIEKTGFNHKEQSRNLSIPFVDAHACLQWLRKTGVRPKTGTTQSLSKSQYKSVIAQLNSEFNKNQNLQFKMLDVVLWH